MQQYWRSMHRHQCLARQHRHSREVSFNIGDCGVGITPQMCNRVTNHGDMGIFPDLTEIMMLYVHMATKKTTYSSSHPCPMSMCTMKKLKIHGWERSSCCRCVGLMYYEDDCCADNYIRCVSCENWQLQYWYKSRVWDGETVGLKQYGTKRLQNGFIAWCNCKDNRE